jgi:hypothetical protein
MNNNSCIAYLQAQDDIVSNAEEDFWRYPVRDGVTTNVTVGVEMNHNLLRAADRYPYTGCGSTAYCYLFCLGMGKYIYT